jgi:hypothetical protein
MVGSPVWGTNTASPIKNREEEGALAFGGHRLIKTPNNQPRVGGSGRGYVIAEADGGGGSAVEDSVQSFGVANGMKKIYNNKHIVAFGGLQSNIITQQPTKNWQARGRRGRRRGTNVGEWQRDANVPRLRVKSVRGQRTTLSTTACCWVMTLSAMTPIRQ